MKANFFTFVFTLKQFLRHIDVVSFGLQFINIPMPINILYIYFIFILSNNRQNYQKVWWWYSSGYGLLIWVNMAKAHYSITRIIVLWTPSAAKAILRRSDHIHMSPTLHWVMFTYIGVSRHFWRRSKVICRPPLIRIENVAEYFKGYKR